MDRLTPKGLAESVVNKHDQFIKRYSKELETGERVSVLREKRDQLKHWIADSKSKDKYVKALVVVEGELKEIENSGLLKPSNYYKELKKKIDEHAEAKEYWLGEVKEVNST